MNKMNNISNLETIDNIKLKPETFDKYYNKIVIICNDLPYNFRKKLRYLRECSGKTREKLEENSHISVQTIKEIETNNSRGYSLETIIALCIGMHLPPEFSFELLNSAGFTIENNSTEKNCIYCFILRNMYNCDIDEINAFLLANNIQPVSIDK